MEIKDILGLGETSTKLIDVVSKGIGTAWSPIQIRLEASAKAYEIKRIAEAVNFVNDAQKSIEYNGGSLTVISDKGYFPPEAYTELSTRITDRTMYQQVKKQLNLENTIYFAQEEFISGETVSSEPLDEDWITRFFNIIEHISNEQMQQLWGKILAGEVKRPQSYSLRTLELLKNLSSEEAEVFRKVSMSAITVNNDCILISDDDVLKKEFDVSFSDQLLLCDLGLISSITTLVYTFEELEMDEDENIFIIGDDALIVKRKKGSPYFELEIRSYTTVGKELLQLLHSSTNENYFNLLVDKLSKISKIDLYRAKVTRKNGELLYGDRINILHDT